MKLNLLVFNPTLFTPNIHFNILNLNCIYYGL